MIRWLILAAVLGLGIAAFFVFGRDAAPFHSVQSLPAIEGHR